MARVRSWYGVAKSRQCCGEVLAAPLVVQPMVNAYGVTLNLFDGAPQCGTGGQRAQRQCGGQQRGQQQDVRAWAEIAGGGIRRGNAEDQHRRGKRQDQ